MLSLSDLPEPLLLDILEYLRPIDVICCRGVSATLYQTLTSQDLCRHLILSFFPRALEGRLLRSLNTAEEGDIRAIQDAKDWANVFSVLARRYHNLAAARPGTVTKITPLTDRELLRQVTPWKRVLRRPFTVNRARTGSFLLPDPVWTYGREQGVLVYPDTDFRYRALDIATGKDFHVPFDTSNKIVRRIRLYEAVLVFEWAEKEAYHELNAQEVVHRHFATAFNVQKHTSRYDLLPDLVIENRQARGEPQAVANEAGVECFLDITFRAEWKIHYLGLPLSDEDRFFSAHNSTHYVLYVWQPNRSPYWEDDPLERLIVWDISAPSPRPNDTPAPATPQVILRLTNAELGPLGIRQNDTPTLRSLSLARTTVDPHTGSPAGHLFFHAEDHAWSYGPHASSDPTFHHYLSSTGIPLTGHGPIWRSECRYPRVGPMPCPAPAFSDILHADSLRPGGDTPSVDELLWPGQAPCWRHRLDSFIANAEVLDPLAGVHIVAATDLKTNMMRANVRSELRANREPDRLDRYDHVDQDPDDDSEEPFPRFDVDLEGNEVPFRQDMWWELMARGVLEGDERWVIGEDQDGDITIVTF